jgi:hypothetical protein
VEPGDELAVLALVAERLDAAGLSYMVSGSVAMNYYAQPRMTRDIDIVVALEPAHASQIQSLFEADFICEASAICEAIARRGMFNLIHKEWVIKVDIIVRKDTPYRREELARRRRVRLRSLELSVVSPEDLVLSKLDWARESRSELQLRDVRNLLTSVPDLDGSYLDLWAAELGVTELLAEART